MENNKFTAKMNGYEFIYDGENIVTISQSWDTENPDVVSTFSIGKVDTQRKFEMEVMWWLQKNSEIF